MLMEISEMTGIVGGFYYSVSSECSRRFFLHCMACRNVLLFNRCMSVFAFVLMAKVGMVELGHTDEEIEILGSLLH